MFVLWRGEQFKCQTCIFVLFLVLTYLIIYLLNKSFPFHCTSIQRQIIIIVRKLLKHLPNFLYFLAELLFFDSL